MSSAADETPVASSGGEATQSTKKPRARAVKLTAAQRSQKKVDELAAKAKAAEDEVKAARAENEEVTKEENKKKLEKEQKAEASKLAKAEKSKVRVRTTRSRPGLRVSTHGLGRVARHASRISGEEA